MFHALFVSSATNYGMAFTKDGSPGDTKFAMIDRSIAHLVRSIGRNAHTDSEFEAHMAKPDQQKSLMRFRLMVSLIGAVKLAIKGVPAFQPNLAYANRVWDYLDKQVLVGEYNLPHRQPRKCLKRESNLSTMCVMSAVCNVFVFKQTAVEWEAGRLGEDGKPQPFRWSMLYDVIRQLHPTPEQIFMAWSQGLDYNIGTAAHTFAGMTAVCESFGVKVGDWMKKPPAHTSDVASDSEMRSPSYSMHAKPTRQPHESEEDYELTLRTWNARCDQQSALEQQLEVFSPLVTPEGVTKADRQFMLRGLERQRRVTSLYRHQCSRDGNSDLLFSDPVATISKIMASVALPADLEEQPGGSAEGPSMPVFPSCIMASAVQVQGLYHAQALVQWCRGGLATASELGEAVEVGSRSELKFRKRQGTGAARWDTAWMRIDAMNTGRWDGVAKVMRSRNETCKIFDITTNAFRDTMFLMSTKDNFRRITDEPRIPFAKRNPFLTPQGEPASPSAHVVKMRGIYDARDGSTRCCGEAAARHPYACMPDVALQRQLDFVAADCCLPAILPMISNKAINDAPLRLVEERAEGKAEGSSRHVELNTAAAFEHTKFIAEAALRCSLHPGMENTQERFCDDMPGPDGLSAEHTNAAEEGSSTTLPYAYDLPAISITLDAMARFYNPSAAEYYEMYRDSYRSLGFRPRVEDAPHICLRFVGFPEDNRLLLSMPVPQKPSPLAKDVQTGKDPKEQGAMHSAARGLVSLMHGHNASEEEVEAYMAAREGARSLSGVDGPLFSADTWQRHSITALKERGMVSDMGDVPVGVVADGLYGLRMRLYALASIKINRIVDADDRMEQAEEPQPGDSLLSSDRLRAVKEERRRAKRHELYSAIELDKDLEPLRFCGELRITEERKMHLTYHSIGKAGSKRKDAPVKAKLTDASAVSDLKRLNRGLLPTVSRRGTADSRKRPLGR